VSEWLDLMASTTVISEGAVYLAGSRRWARDRFRVFDRAVSRGRQLDDGTIAERNYVWFSDWQLQNINSRHLLPIDIDVYQRLRTHIARAQPLESPCTDPYARWCGTVGDRRTLCRSMFPILTWAGAIDPVGGDTLAWLLRSMAYRGAIALSGLTGGIDVHTTVIPFILRGVKLLGIDSVMCPMDERLEAWRRLATDMKLANLGASVREIRLADLPDAFETLKKGEARGRFVVKLRT
jgi:hypothetical protein